MSQRLDHRSPDLHEPLDRAAQRALLHSTGVSRADMRKPLVAIVNSWTDEVAHGRAAWQPPARSLRGILARYARPAESASKGAIPRTPGRE